MGSVVSSAGCLRLRVGSAGGLAGGAGWRVRQVLRCWWSWLPEAKSLWHRLHHLRAPGVMLDGVGLSVLGVGGVPALGGEDGLVSAAVGCGGGNCI